MKKTLLLSALCVILSQWAIAQQDPMFTKYMFNSLTFNPAYAGSHDFLTINALYRSQWSGWNNGLEDGGAPITQSLTLHTPFKKRVGLGINVINDKIGASESTSLNFAYAYRIGFGNGKLAVGLQAGVTNWRAEWSKLRFKDPRVDDAAFANDNVNDWIPNVGAGIYYNSQFFYAGFSVPRMLGLDLPNTAKDSTNFFFAKNARQYRHYYITVGGAIPIAGPDLMFKPSLLVKSIGLFQSFSGNQGAVQPEGAPTEFDIDLSLLIYEKWWIGASFRSAFSAVFSDKSSYDSADIWMAFYLRNGLRIGAAYDYSLTAIQNYSSGSFELMLGYDFQYRVQRADTPRYF